jgi:uncharacterized membrane protein
MKTMWSLLRATVVGGLLFLVPVAIVLLVLRQALAFARGLAQSVAAHLPEGVTLGVGAISVMAVLILVLVSFLAGLVAQTPVGKRVMAWFETSLLGGLPQYQVFKSMAQTLGELETSAAIQPVLVNLEEGWQIGYLVERLDGDWVAAFVPQAPTPMAGTILYLPADRVRALDMTLVQAMGIVKHMGLGSAEALQGVDLSLPRPS